MQHMLFEGFDLKPSRTGLVSIFETALNGGSFSRSIPKGRHTVLSFTVLDCARKQQPRLAAGQALI